MTGSKAPELHPIGRPLGRCPACGSDALEPVVEVATDDVHFRCEDCGWCWHVEFGFVHRMGPHACTGCPHRASCEAVYAADHPWV